MSCEAYQPDAALTPVGTAEVARVTGVPVAVNVGKLDICEAPKDSVGLAVLAGVGPPIDAGGKAPYEADWSCAIVYEGACGA